ncbi:MAG: hypothetical protein P0Y65_20585 [Candidatus Devosia phytovorans]|uniref:Uncharacterized protein n=1 Tax=Candidatus Devosia phytovorans TaxID=3121372 RepID=A0AAJ5VUS0_9HYPH|nr:hypothetical protein [Devosia sp.]WEK04540.1 MAG: hypothetical protein P0Y65_20585 [Devosia sp.]
MSAWAKPGAKCVCIVAAPGCWISPNGTMPGPLAPQHNGTYTIAAIELKLGEIYLVLAECDREEMFHVSCFRPAANQGSDVALFAHHLAYAGEPA